VVIFNFYFEFIINISNIASNTMKTARGVEGCY
jgi:hypothetical protein